MALAGAVGFIRRGRVLHATSTSASCWMVATGFIWWHRFGVIGVGSYARGGGEGEVSYNVDPVLLASGRMLVAGFIWWYRHCCVGCSRWGGGGRGFVWLRSSVIGVGLIEVELDRIGRVEARCSVLPPVEEMWIRALAVVVGGDGEDGYRDRDRDRWKAMRERWVGDEKWSKES